MAKEDQQKTTNLDNIEPDEVDRSIALLLIENPCFTDEQIGQRLSLCRQSINVRRNSRGVQLALDKLLSIPEERIRRILSKALERVECHLDDSDPKVSLAAANQIIRLAETFVTPA